MLKYLGQGGRSNIFGQAALPISTNPISLFSYTANDNEFSLPLPSNPENYLTFGLSSSF